MSAASMYASATREELLARIAELEKRATPTATASTSTQAQLPFAQDGTGLSRRAAKKQQKKQERGRHPAAAEPLHDSSKDAAATNNDSNDNDEAFFARYASRKIALRFSYEGWLYGGLALQNGPTPLPSVEAVLLDALVRARLVPRSAREEPERVQFSRCGRTDRGVSAAGQVVSLRVRSQLCEEEGRQERSWRPPVVVVEKPAAVPQEKDMSAENVSVDEAHRKKQKQKQAARDTPRPELPYQHLLNRALPPSIRVLAWSPVEDSFDSRFSCVHRHYKYFFSAPSSPTSGNAGPLNLEAMREAAARMVGEHDFRNLCKVDPTKQITNFRRRILSATISRLSPSSACSLSSGPEGEDTDPMYVLDLKGSAFLYHQVRHVMAVLFLVGSGKESPSVVDALLNTGYWDDALDTCRTRAEAEMPVVRSRPAYEMADDLPLVLWDCTFAEGSVQWRQDGGGVPGQNGNNGSRAASEMYEHNAAHRLRATISQHFLDAYRSYSPETTGSVSNGRAQRDARHAAVQIGAGRVLMTGKYVPLLERPRSDLVEDINRRWAEGQGKRRAERKAAAAENGRNDAMSVDGE